MTGGFGVFSVGIKDAIDKVLDTYTYPKNSHTIVVTGVDKEYYYVNDPLQSEGNTKVKKKDLEKSFDSLGRQVVGIQKFGDK